jgi:hypothetical protein
MNVMDRILAHRKRWRAAEKEVRDRLAKVLNEADDNMDPTIPAVTSWPSGGDEFTVDLTLEDGTPVRATVRVTLYLKYYDRITWEGKELHWFPGHLSDGGYVVHLLGYYPEDRDGSRDYKGPRIVGAAVVQECASCQAELPPAIAPGLEWVVVEGREPTGDRGRWSVHQRGQPAGS